MPPKECQCEHSKHYHSSDSGCPNIPEIWVRTDYGRFYICMECYLNACMKSADHIFKAECTPYDDIIFKLNLMAEINAYDQQQAQKYATQLFNEKQVGVLMMASVYQARKYAFLDAIELVMEELERGK